jgi:hypothetical protein
MIEVPESRRELDIKGVNQELTVEVVTEASPCVFGAKPHLLCMH